jgi:hypothetical protein
MCPNLGCRKFKIAKCMVGDWQRTGGSRENFSGAPDSAEGGGISPCIGHQHNRGVPWRTATIQKKENKNGKTRKIRIKIKIQETKGKDSKLFHGTRLSNPHAPLERLPRSISVLSFLLFLWPSHRDGRPEARFPGMELSTNCFLFLVFEIGCSIAAPALEPPVARVPNPAIQLAAVAKSGDLTPSLAASLHPALVLEGALRPTLPVLASDDLEGGNE